VRVVGLDSLRPGAYTGEIQLQATNPAGRPMDVNIRPGAALPVTLQVDRPLAAIDSQAVDFGEVQFDTSPNFRLDQTALLPVAFAGRQFKVTATVDHDTCANVNIVTGDLVEQDGRTLLPLHLTSAGPVQPATCRGAITFSGPNGDYDVTPGRLDWESRVSSVEWSIVGGDLNLADLQDAGARVDETLLVRFNGKTPFVVEMAGVQANGSSHEDGAAPIALSGAELDMPAVEVNGPPNEAGLYEVPITLIARQEIPGDPLRGNFYSGQLQLAVAGLEGDAKAVGFTFRSPSLYQRYLAPVLVPVYSLPWLICTGPLTLLLLLVVVARIRGRSLDDRELEQAAVSATREAVASVAVAPEPIAPLPSASSTTARTEAAWGKSEWGSVWSSGSSTDAAAPTYSANGVRSQPSSSDPWSTSW
jgi:hypothetical protein